MKTIAMIAVIGVCTISGLALSQPAQAAGCLRGAVVGGVAGHFVGHHGLLGAGVGCAIGHHEASRHSREGFRDRRDRY